MKSLSAILFAVLLPAIGVKLEAAEEPFNFRDPAFVIQGYLRATYGRDYVNAYRYISRADQRVKDVNRYAQQRGVFMGFALEAARKLASFIEIRPTQKQLASDRIQAVTKIGVAEPSLLFNLDPRKLNAMAVDERRQLIESWDKKKRDGSLQMIEVEEKLELVKEGDEWRIFLNWAAGVKIPLRLVLSNAADLEASVSKSEVVVQPGEFFEIFLKVKNRSSQPLVARIGHLVEPREVTNFLDFVECGFLLPITVPPGKEEEYYARYLLRGSLPEGVRQLNLTYDFRPLK
ncbi:MAG TPA: cytochrome c oxidase assembly protein [Candidatus Binatia bacterium]|nr:cytochrome c oxidase assembly protein [Candidatus Binatia bacterium]